jgi:hypothetical protein
VLLAQYGFVRLHLLPAFGLIDNCGDGGDAVADVEQHVDRTLNLRGPARCARMASALSSWLAVWP